GNHGGGNGPLGRGVFLLLLNLSEHIVERRLALRLAGLQGLDAVLLNLRFDVHKENPDGAECVPSSDGQKKGGRVKQERTSPLVYRLQSGIAASAAAKARL